MSGAHSVDRGVVCDPVPTMPPGGAPDMSGRGGAAQQAGSERGQPTRKSYDDFPSPLLSPKKSAASPAQSPKLLILSRMGGLGERKPVKRQREMRVRLRKEAVP